MDPFLLPAALVALVATVVVISLTRRRHGEVEVADPSWSRTEEIFRDPSTGRIMRVWIDPVTHDRHYVPEPGVLPRRR